MSKKSRKHRYGGPGLVNVSNSDSCYLCFKPLQPSDRISVLMAGTKSFKLCNNCAREYQGIAQE